MRTHAELARKCDAALETQDVCVGCEQVQATVDCESCGLTLCDKCFESVHAHALLKKHGRAKAGTIKSAQTNAKLEKCPVHPAHHTNVFCVDDQELVCAECLADKHSGHKFVTIGQAMAVVTSELSEVE